MALRIFHYGLQIPMKDSYELTIRIIFTDSICFQKRIILEYYKKCWVYKKNMGCRKKKPVTFATRPTKANCMLQPVT